MIVVGSIMLSTMGNFTAFEGAVNTQTIPICIIVIGSVTFVVAFFGCCGTIRENACCTTVVSYLDPLTIRSGKLMVYPSFQYAICMLIHSVKCLLFD